MDFLPSITLLKSNSTDGVGGRVKISVTGGTAIVPLVGTQSYVSLTTAETVKFYDATMTLLATTTLTRVSDSSFTAGADVTGAVWMMPQFFNDGTTPWNYEWADTKSKGDFVYRAWLAKNTDVTTPVSISQSQEAIAFTPCAESALAITPNGETFKNGAVFSFPTSINNGETWLGQIEDWMNDPLWQPPHRPCGLDGSVSWLEDDGTCLLDDDTHAYYARRPYVEALCALPRAGTGSPQTDVPPAIPGVDLTTVQPVPSAITLNLAADFIYNVIANPAMTWGVYLRELGCVEATGKFSTSYIANGTTNPP